MSISTLCGWCESTTQLMLQASQHSFSDRSGLLLQLLPCCLAAIACAKPTCFPTCVGWRRCSARKASAECKEQNQRWWHVQACFHQTTEGNRAKSQSLLTRHDTASRRCQQAAQLEARPSPQLACRTYSSPPAIPSYTHTTAKYAANKWPCSQHVAV